MKLNKKIECHSDNQCIDCFYKRKYHREYMKCYRRKIKNDKQLYFPLQESLQFGANK